MKKSKAKLLFGDCLIRLKDLEDNSIDSLVTDPPAGIAFMGKAWDSDKGGRDQWIKWLAEIMRECLRVMKPGAYGLVWALPKTSHWTATALEDAGFDIRDRVAHLFGSGFPKSQNISIAIDKQAGAKREVVGHQNYTAPDIRGNSYDQSHVSDRDRLGVAITAPATDAAKLWNGWGTALKPAVEDWWLIQKPISEKTIAKNVLKWGTGAINIDASRIGTDAQGRFPSHLLLSCSDTCTEDAHDMLECPIAMLDEQSGQSFGVERNYTYKNNGGWKQTSKQKTFNSYGDSGGASRFFYCAKASKSDKGLANTHPTVKNTKLMSYLIRMFTPPNGLVIDCFMGSGSTGVAAIKEGFEFIGIEQSQEYFQIAAGRIKNCFTK